jgi:hypothetical protein
VEDADSSTQMSPKTNAWKEDHEMWSVKGESVLELGADELLLSFAL